MRTIVSWTAAVVRSKNFFLLSSSLLFGIFLQPTQNETRPVIWDVCFDPSGTRLVAAVGNKLIVYDAVTGEVIKYKTGA